VNVGEDGANERDHGGGVGDDVDHAGAVLGLVDSFERVGRPDLLRVRSREAVKAVTSALASSINGPPFGGGLGELVAGATAGLEDHQQERSLAQLRSATRHHLPWS
jgi:hypothetical protein